MHSNKPGRGGKRKNAGRPAIGTARMQDITLTLSADDIRYLRKLGKGNASEGCREAIRRLTSGYEYTG